ncbi:hypothetical protein ACHAXT_011455 [Thalassiosira profunda]
MVSVAAVAVAVATLGGAAIAAAGVDQQTASAAVPRRLPQHRVRTPARTVPYPENHPLGRHLKQDVTDEEIIDEGEEDGFIVGGDGSRARRNRMRQRQPNPRRLLRFFSPSADPPTPPGRRRREAKSEEPEAIREGRLVENAGGETLRYWTISGRNLVESSAGGDADEEDGDSSAQLLMDVEQINVENGEANYDEAQRVGERENGGSEAGESTMKEEDQATSFDTDQYYNDQGESNDQGDGYSKLGGDEEEPPASLYQPIRLRAILTDDETSGSKHLTKAHREILMNDILNPALFAWSRALHVVPVGGGRRRMAGDGGEEYAGANLVVDPTQLFDGASCGPGLDSGLPSVRVPTEHMTQGLEDTDAVIYVSVAFADQGGSLVSTAPEEDPEEGGEESEDKLATLYHLHSGATGPKYAKPMTRKKDVELEASMVAKNETSGPSAYPSTSPSYSPSFPPTELEPFVESRPTCPGTYLASATYCNTDQFDRPVAGVLSLCISDVHDFFHNPEQIKRNVVTTIHELGHVLGFNAQSLAHFRDPDTGEPLTPRDERGDVPDKGVECTGVGVRAKSAIPLPSKDILKFRTVRGGVRTATIVTPTVRRVARNMFGCRTLAGAELQAGEGQMFISDGDEPASMSAGDCIGDHWARRLFRTDLMNAIVDDVAYSLSISSLTLAYFADSGWYKVNTDRLAPPQMWGRNAGCNFVDRKCITSSGQVPAKNNPFFCNNAPEKSPEDDEENKEDTKKEDNKKETEKEEEEVAEIHGCDLDSSRKAVCSLVEYELPMPDEFNYFEHARSLDHEHFYGGSDATLDFCPVYEGFVNGRCDDEESKELMEVRGHLEVFGEPNSRCVVGKVEKKRTALCMPIACVIQEQSLMVKVDGYWKPCSYAGQIISVWWNPNDYVVCPDPSRMCPTFYCHDDCMREGGVCDYQQGQCLCASSLNSTIANNTAWFSNYYSYQRFEPCSGEYTVHSSSGSSQVVERIDFALPDYYVENTTLLLDEPRDFDDKVSRMFAQLTGGEVFGLVASFMFCAIMTYIVWSQVVRCYKRRLVGTSLLKARSSVGSLSRMLRSASQASLGNDGHGDNDSLPSHRRPPRGRNPQKDKMVATLMVQNRLELAGLATATSEDSDEKKKAENTTHTIVDLSSPSDEEVLVNRSDLPPLEGGRVLAVVGARIVEDERTQAEDDDAQSSATAATQTSQAEMSEFASPLFHDDNEGRGGRRGRTMLRLRRQL